MGVMADNLGSRSLRLTHYMEQNPEVFKEMYTAFERASEGAKQYYAEINAAPITQLATAQNQLNESFKDLATPLTNASIPLIHVVENLAKIPGLLTTVISGFAILAGSSAFGYLLTGLKSFYGTAALAFPTIIGWVGSLSAALLPLAVQLAPIIAAGAAIGVIAAALPTVWGFISDGMERQGNDYLTEYSKTRLRSKGGVGGSRSDGSPISNPVPTPTSSPTETPHSGVVIHGDANIIIPASHAREQSDLASLFKDHFRAAGGSVQPIWTSGQ